MDAIRDKFTQAECTPMEEDRRLHLHHLRGQKIKDQRREPNAEDEKERIDSISKRGRLVPPNDVISDCAVGRSGIRSDRVYVFRNTQCGRGQI